MEQDAIQFLYIMGAIILQIIVIVGLFTKQERRLTRLETLLSQCCNSLGIHTGEL